jgi:hypothetical protein
VPEQEEQCVGDETLLEHDGAVQRKSLQRTYPHQQSFAWPVETEAEEKERLEQCRIATEEEAKKDAFFVLTVQQGDTGRVRECLEENAHSYLGGYMRKILLTQRSEERATPLSLVARDLFNYRKTHNLLGTRDTNLDQLACIALLRIDPQAVQTFLEAGADVKVLETEQFTWEQIKKVADWFLFGVAGRSNTVYTPLHYFLQFKKRKTFSEKNKAGCDAIIQQLIARGVDFHAPTPTRHVPYVEASKHDQHLITRAEKARQKQLKRAKQLAKQQG